MGNPPQQKRVTGDECVTMSYAASRHLDPDDETRKAGWFQDIKAQQQPCDLTRNVCSVRAIASGEPRPPDHPP
jgi:hypothetical protein